MEGGRVRVPVDCAHRSGRSISIALSMVPATAPKSEQQGVMLVNPGGPGGPGRGMASWVAQGIAPQVAGQCDIVGFDPRGAGGAVPALRCAPTFFVGAAPDSIPTSAATEQLMRNGSKHIAP